MTRLQPYSREVLSDLETPLTVYLKLARAGTPDPTTSS